MHADGLSLGLLDGIVEGDRDGLLDALGLAEGRLLGDAVGCPLGLVVGETVGDVLGRSVGQAWPLHDEVSPPAHALPPQLGAGFVHERVHVPPPHAAGHGDPHALHAPCTVGQCGW